MTPPLTVLAYLNETFAPDCDMIGIQPNVEIKECINQIDEFPPSGIMDGLTFVGAQLEN